MNILVVEDDPLQRRLLVRTLKRWGYRVFEADDGVEAIDIIRRESIPLIITDWMMPRMDGPELCRAIRDEDGMLYHYVIMLTSRSDKESLVQGLDLGADDYIAKPFTPGELSARIHVGQRTILLQEELQSRIGELATLNQKIVDAHRRMEEDLAMAAEVQKAFLPHRAPPCRSTQFSWRWRPCGSLGGDYLNVFPLSENHLGLLVLDVSGHGVPAALTAVTLSHILQPKNDDSILYHKDPSSGERKPCSPIEVAETLNRHFPLNLETGQYFTLFYGILDTKQNELQYTTAGGPGPVLLSHQGDVSLLEGYDFPIGIQNKPCYKTQKVQLKPNDRLLIMTDGIFEAADSEGAPFGTEKVSQILTACRKNSLDETLDRLINSVVVYSQDQEPADDISILALETLDMATQKETTPQSPVEMTR